MNLFMTPVELSGGRVARETDHQQQDVPLYHKASHTAGGTCLKGELHPYLSCLALRGLGCTVEFNLLILQLCTEVLQQPTQHRHGFIFTLNKKDLDIQSMHPSL